MKKKSLDNLLAILIVLGAVLGAFLGWFYGPKMTSIAFLGDLFLNSLKMIVVPLVLLSIIVGVTSLGDVRKVGGIGIKTIFYYMITTGIAVFIGLVLVNIIKPGIGVAISTGHVASTKPMTISDLILSFVHPSLIDAMAKNMILPIIVFAIVFGLALSTLGTKGKSLVNLIDVLNDAILKVVHIILWLAPIGVFALVSSKLGASGGGNAFMAELLKIGKYTLTVIIGLSIHGLIILPLLLLLLGRRNPFKYAWGVLETMITAFSTSSSSATLPITLENVKENNNVPEASADFVLPIGATINMDGTALYEAIAAVFIAQAYGIELTFGHQVMIFVTATLASVGAAGIPQAGFVTMAVVLQSVGLPLEGIGILLTVDWFLDRLRTMVNVWGDTIGAAVISRCKEFGK